MGNVIVLYKIYISNDLLKIIIGRAPVTPIDPWMNSEPKTYVEGHMLVDVHELLNYAVNIPSESKSWTNNVHSK